MFPLLNKIPKDIGKVKFELKFNESRWIEKPFIVNVLYSQIDNMPFGLEFVKFVKDSDIGKVISCLHNCVQNRQVRFFIKNVPEGIKPFSLKLTVCPDCGAPMEYRFIVYPGELKMYPKMRDIKKFKKKIVNGNDPVPPKAIESPVFRIGATNGTSQ